MTKAEKTRNFIIEKSAPIFNVKGIAGTAMSDIMEATGLAKGSLYVHFEDKEALSLAVVDYNLDLVLKAPIGEARMQKTPKAKLLAFVNVLVERNASIPGGCPLLNFGMEADDTSPLIRKKVNKAIDKIQQTLHSFVTMGIQAGEFKKGWNANVFAIKTFALIEGGIMMTKISGNREKRKMILDIIVSEIEANSVR